MAQIIANSLVAASIYGLFAASFSLIYSTVRFFHIAHGATLTVGAFTGYAVVTSPWIEVLSLPDPVTYLLAALGAGVAGVVTGVLTDRIVYRPLRDSHASALILLLTSFGVFVVVQNLIALLYGNQLRSVRLGPIEQGYQVLGARITPFQFVIVAVALGFFVVLGYAYRRTRIGRFIRAVADDESLARIAGIDAERVITYAFAAGSALVGIAGVLVAFETNLQPSMGFEILLKGIVAVIVGGIGSIYGAYLGALLVGLVENLAGWFLPSVWQDPILFSLLLLALLIRPHGILGQPKSRRE